MAALILISQLHVTSHMTLAWYITMLSQQLLKDNAVRFLISILIYRLSALEASCIC